MRRQRNCVSHLIVNDKSGTQLIRAFPAYQRCDDYDDSHGRIAVDGLIGMVIPFCPLMDLTRPTNLTHQYVACFFYQFYEFVVINYNVQIMNPRSGS
jgi:hypothetical protein